MKQNLEVEAMESAEKINAKLKQFIGSEVIYKHRLGIGYTSGIKYLVEAAECLWLLDCIASYQTINLLSYLNLKEFQIWRLLVRETSGVLICEWDTNLEVLRQEIPYTDFPLPDVKVYLVEKVLMLPSEY
jgi:hypothetical protein